MTADKAVSQAAHDKLRALRERLAQLEPYPWQPVEAWIASATPLIKAHYREMFEDFVSATATPRWCELPRFSSGGGRRGEPRRDNFAEAAAVEQREDRKSASAAKEKILALLDGLIDLPPLVAQPPALAGAIRHQSGAYYHHGDVIMSGSKFDTNITGSNVGAFGQGDGATVTGTLNMASADTLTQEHHKAAITEAQTALIHDQDALERIDDRLYEALGQFLTMARKIQVDQQSIAEVQAKMRETLDEVWAQQVAKGMKAQALPKGLKVIGALAASPVTVEVAKKLLGA
jgi:anti-anti-sigma regulatory factor